MHVNNELLNITKQDDMDQGTAPDPSSWIRHCGHHLDQAQVEMVWPQSPPQAPGLAEMSEARWTV